MQPAIRNPTPAENDAELLLANARKSFMLAGKAANGSDIARYAAMGRDYLGLAHQAAEIVGTTPNRVLGPALSCHWPQVPQMEPKPASARL